ncbi:glycoside hydrolase family 3 C-terminal domain-containing protein [Phytohabitans sp. ZYX-F-186]|uniref:Glycoside hydrolase family 3 C-terminal domain-containing protein n=1 Tax=Phytohabitans maris TaxID=3071409 RepID=A0ABU0Z9D8_9ACTN|nr:glycoside hydrolase family 3 C-terminal domain-containing protein [Phytohabitans sp. ZYX-F-186]MDQ7902942.1 glycoside hydrolase family 3 C-terminal domain-containing protein [Phytohabitans sp. ZYX-F-186]
MSIIEEALAALDLETKVRLLSGQDFWTLPAIPEIGLRSLVMSDGPIGLRGIGWRPDDPSVALPSPTALAATWDPELARTAGRVLGQEARRKGVHVLLAPTVNLHRSPFGGRHFECYSEDPLLTGEIGAAYVAGVQDQGVGTTVKHFVANDSETDRFTVDVRVDERALRELYLAPFERIVGAGAWGVMSAYNGVNGSTMTEHADLQIGVLKREWGFDGVVVSDWTAARSTAPAANGGLDVVMPAVGDPWGEALVAAVRSGAVPEEVVDDKVRRVLRLAARVGILDGASPAAGAPSTLDGAAVAREIAARSFVLARNSGGLLPLDPARLRTVALSGALAADARVQGGGSALVQPARVVSPLDGLSAALGGATVTYSVGADPRRRMPVARGPQWSGITGVLRAADGRELFRASLPTAYVRWMGDPPPGVAPDEIAELALSARVTPSVGGAHELAIVGFGDFTLTAGGRTLFEGSLYRDRDESAVFRGPAEQRFPLDLAAGEPVDVVLTQRGGNPGFVSFAIGHAPPSPGPDALLDEAASAAAAADVAVVVVGTTEEVESEGFDRTTLALPGRQDELVSRVATANPRTVVVVNAGSPVLMPWADEVAAILLTWFPGQEAGAALADMLLGAAEPGGRLPTTWPRHDRDALPVTPTDGALPYDEGVFLGYRADPADPLFPFGHGLGYTDWAYESLSIEDGGEAVTVTVTVRNAGARPGREVVQVYIGPSTPDPSRPRRWLVGFAAAEAGPGEAVTVRVPLPERAFQVWDGGWRKVPGSYLVEAAHSVADRRLTAELTV